MKACKNGIIGKPEQLISTAWKPMIIYAKLLTTVPWNELKAISYKTCK
jgi:hypothetical protein